MDREIFDIKVDGIDYQIDAPLLHAGTKAEAREITREWLIAEVKTLNANSAGRDNNEHSTNTQ